MSLWKKLFGGGNESVAAPPIKLSTEIFPLYIQDLQSGVYYYFKAPWVYVDRNEGPNLSIAKSVVEDILQEPDAYKESKLYAISGQKVWADGSHLVAEPAVDGAEFAPSEGGIFAHTGAFLR